MAKVNKPDMSALWAEAGTIITVSDSDISEGWVVEKPPFEEMNFVQNRQDKASAYLMQMGVVEWDSVTEYQENSYVQYLGVVYKSVGVNTNKQPNIFVGVNWNIAFDNYGSADVVQQELDALIADDDPFNQYVLKAEPTFTIKTNGTSFSANSGLPTDNLSDVGFSFTGDGDSGLFKDNDDLVFVVDAVEKGRVKKSAVGSLDNSTAFVTTAHLRTLLHDILYPVGKIEITTEPTDPAVRLGFGVWQRFGEGRAIVGYSSDVTSATPDWYKVVGNVYGSENTTLSVDNIPPHKHRTPITNTSNSVATYEFTQLTPAPSEFYTIPQDTRISDNGYGMKKSDLGSTGGGLPFNNVQPSVVVYMWKRVA